MKKYILVILAVLMTFSGCNTRTNTSQSLETSSESVQSSGMVSAESSPSSSNNLSEPDESPSDINISSSVSEPPESQVSNTPSSAPSSSTPAQTVTEPDATTVYIELSSSTITLNQINNSILVPYKIYNTSSREVFSSPSYMIEKYNGAEWTPFPFNELDQPNWPSVVYTIPADGSFDESLSYWAFEEEMTPGTYRLVKRASEEGKESLVLYAKFSVTE